jgi:hypothetical protein
MMAEAKYLKSYKELPEIGPYSRNSKWVRIHLSSGLTCLGYYNYQNKVWKEFHDLKNLHNTSTITESRMKGWHY